MKSISVIAVAMACCATAACDNSGAGMSPARGANSGLGTQSYGTSVDNPMASRQGGFNNDDINGKSRNPYSTTPGTGPMNANPIASGNAAPKVTRYGGSGGPLSRSISAGGSDRNRSDWMGLAGLRSTDLAITLAGSGGGFG